MDYETAWQIGHETAIVFHEKAKAGTLDLDTCSAYANVPIEILKGEMKYLGAYFEGYEQFFDALRM